MFVVQTLYLICTHLKHRSAGIAIRPKRRALFVYMSLINETHAPIAYYRPETNGWLLCLHITMMRTTFDLSINHRMEPISFTCFAS